MSNTVPGARSRLRASRISQQVLVAASHPDPERVRRQLHDALEAYLPRALTARFEAMANAGDTAVWRIRHLAMDLVVNTAWDADAMAAAWASECERAVTRAIESGGDGVTAIRFASPAAYLASFLLDVANGSCWTRWWYTDFAGLKLLSRATTVRTALLRKPRVGLDALGELEPSAAAMVINEITRHDARLVVDGLGAQLPDGELTTVPPAISALVQRGALPVHHDDEERWVLRVLAETVRDTAAKQSRGVVPVARAVARLATRVVEQSARMVVTLHALRLGDAMALRAVTTAEDGETLSALLTLTAADREGLIESVTRGDTPRVVVQADGAPELRWMPVAAPLLLVGTLTAMDIDAVCAGWTGIGDEESRPDRQASAAAIVRLSVLAVACGGERAFRVLDDSVTRQLAGVGADVSRAALIAWLHHLSAEHAHVLQQACLAWLRRNGSLSGSTYVMASAVLQDVTPATVLIDTQRGNWCALETAGGGTSMTDPKLDSSSLVWCCAEASMDAAHAAVPAGTVALIDVAALEGNDDLAQVVLRLDRLSEELDWITPPAAFDVAPALLHALQVVAQGLIRTIAWKLPGFSRATMPHLWTNFLAVDAHVALEPQRMLATLSRPPLAMIVSMTGLFQQRVTLPWMTPGTLMLFPAEGR